MAVGFRIRTNTRKVSPEAVEKFRSIPVTNVSDSMSRISTAGSRIRRCTGPARRGGIRPGRGNPRQPGPVRPEPRGPQRLWAVRRSSH
jgi:hypothetical protein